LVEHWRSSWLLVGLYNNTVVSQWASQRAYGLHRSFGELATSSSDAERVLIGVLSALSDQYLSSRWTNAWVFAVLVIILVFRPGGLLGENVQKRFELDSGGKILTTNYLPTMTMASGNQVGNILERSPL